MPRWLRQLKASVAKTGSPFNGAFNDTEASAARLFSLGGR
jgi:hypothetical protein